MTKKSQNILIILAAVIVVGLGFLAVARIITPEDTWLCVNGEWQRHGQPTVTKPTSGCGNANADTNIGNGNNNINANINSNENTNASAGSFDVCVAAGLPVQESYPRKCNMNGQTYTEDIGNELEKANIITLDSPRPNTVAKSPLSISGEARGTWFSEGNFSARLVDEENKILGQVQAQASGDWMTEDFVKYSATLTFSYSGSGKLYLILSKANPSGLAANADELKIPLKLSGN